MTEAERRARKAERERLRYHRQTPEQRASAKQRREPRVPEYNARRRAKAAASPEVRAAKAVANKRWREANKDAIAERNRAYREANCERLRAAAKVRRDADPAKGVAAARDWSQRNLDRHRVNQRRWKQTNRQADLERYRTDVIYRLTKIACGRVRCAVVRKSTRAARRTFELIGCTPEHLRAHIEAQFLPGMSWQNFDQWHIDHIRPLCTFDLTDLDEQAQAFHFTNLRPLWAADNLSRPRGRHPAAERPRQASAPPCGQDQQR